MPKEEWGTKRLCPQCSTRFYDLQNDPMTCPSCGAVYTVEALQSGRTRALISEKTANAETEDTALDDEDLDSDAGDLDDDLLEDDDDDTNVSLDEIADVAEPDED
ncbi:FYDLN acid domain-containing protein [Paracoccus sp. Z118]|uniref:FYDLN acid domain-containing protein n=1 Tax=Paracoccus sp. Z118 TaxID=2851017 RepID=UPI001C2CBB5A|nr:FYDLN acid domain-containing protein [Paracoccus sp. Z118]MBV0893183.1 FYDLN acid domain-containing protein [Paracoccus sp. Z118]